MEKEEKLTLLQAHLLTNSSSQHISPRPQLASDPSQLLLGVDGISRDDNPCLRKEQAGLSSQRNEMEMSSIHRTTIRAILNGTIYESTKYSASVHWYEQIQLYRCMFTEHNT